jgi:hypothetical protein
VSGASRTSGARSCRENAREIVKTIAEEIRAKYGMTRAPLTGLHAPETTLRRGLAALGGPIVTIST